MLQINKTLRRRSLRRNSLGRSFRVLFSIEVIFYLSYPLLQPDHPRDLNALDLQDETGPDSERPLYSQFQNILQQFSSPPTEYSTTTPTWRSQTQFYQEVLSCDRLPNYYDEGLIKFLLKFQSPKMTPNVPTPTHTERFGLNGDSLQNFEMRI